MFKSATSGVSVAVLKPDRLTFAVAPASRPPRTHLSNCHYFTVDGEYRYQSFAQDFGPFNEAVLFKFCRKLNLKLTNSSLERKNIVLYTSGRDLEGKANAAFLIGTYCMLYLHLDPTYVADQLKICGPYAPFRDAALGLSTFNITLLHCFQGVREAAKWRWLDFSTFNVREYELYETVEHGDFNWIIPDKILAFCGPHSRTVRASEGYPTHTPEYYHEYFKLHNITTVVRTNKAIYDSHRFTSAGFEFHEMFFIDGTSPNRDIVMSFLDVCTKTFAAGGGIAVHCKAGLGRTGTLIACYLMKEFMLTAEVAIAWLRVCRPGSVLGQQQSFLKEQESWLWSLGTSQRNETSNKEVTCLLGKVSTIALTESSDVVSMSKPATIDCQLPRAAPCRNNFRQGRVRANPSGGRTQATRTTPPRAANSLMRHCQHSLDGTANGEPSSMSSPPCPDAVRSPDETTTISGPGTALDTVVVYQADLGVSELKTQGDFLREQKTIMQRNASSKIRPPVQRPAVPPASKTGGLSPKPVPRIGSTLEECQKLQMELQTQRGQTKSPLRQSPGKRARVMPEQIVPAVKQYCVMEPLTSAPKVQSIPGTCKTEYSYKLRSSVRERLAHLKSSGSQG